jgi:hypothetical protein
MVEFEKVRFRPGRRLWAERSGALYALPTWGRKRMMLVCDGNCPEHSVLGACGPKG